MSDKEKREAAKAALKDQSKKRKAHVLSITAVIPQDKPPKGLKKKVRKFKKAKKKAERSYQRDTKKRDAEKEEK